MRQKKKLAATRPKEPMVLRSVYLSPAVDAQLQRLAYERQTTIGALIREMVERALLPRSVRRSA